MPIIFSQPIIFNDYYDAKLVKHPDDLVVVLDAVNSDSNVASRWTAGMKQGYLKSLRRACTLIKKTQDEERAGYEESALDTWCRVFGDDFRRLSQ